MINKIKDNLRLQILLDYYGLDKDRKGFYKCHGENTNSIRVYGDRWKCFSCNTGGDVIDFIIHQEHCSNKEAITKAVEIANIDNLTPEEIKNNIKNKPKEIVIDPAVIEKNQKLASEYCQKCFENNNFKYLLSRGISKEIQIKCKIGYNDYRKTVVIPYNSKMTYFIARSINQKDFYKPPQNELGIEPVWNEAVLQTNNTVYVCEGQIDAMSLMELGYKACSVGGTNGGNKLKDYTAELVIAFDNDEKGIQIGNELAKKLKCKTLYPVKYKDWNEWLVEDREGLIKYLQEVNYGR